jgi:uncharacterized protein with PIN domain
MKFFVDCMLGKLARWLRILGYDAAFDPSLDDDEAIALSLSEHRIILTRDRALLKRKRRPEAVFVESTEPRRQILQVLEELRLELDPALFFSRCLVCNAETRPAPREEVGGLVPPYVFATQDRFSRCTHCGRIYWKATHFRNMVAGLGELMKERGKEEA